MPSGKNRGGIPLCAPIFGPGETVGLNQHGFARNCQWEISDQTESQVKLTLDKPASQVDGLPPVYAGCGLELTIRLLENGLQEKLEVRNIGIEAFTANPAFHPYFPVLAGETPEQAKVVIDGQAHQLAADELIATRKIDSISSEAQLVTSRGTWTISGGGLPLFAVWSESSRDFICVEPTESGYLSDSPASKIQPNETKIFTMTLQFFPAAEHID
jgi:galactose mutarotase-like enzyme